MEKINVDHGALADGIITRVVYCNDLLRLQSIRAELPSVMLTPTVVWILVTSEVGW